LEELKKESNFTQRKNIMLKISEKIKRQIEITGLVLAEPLTYKLTDLAEKFDCDNITLKRDLRELREAGIDIHSINRKGLLIENKPELNLIAETISRYLLLANVNTPYTKAIQSLVEKLGLQALSNITKLQSAIEEKKVVEIKYEKTEEQIEKRYEINPLAIFVGENEWRLIALFEKEVRQFLVPRIKEVRATEKSFSTKGIITDAIFSTTLSVWVSEEEYEVELKFHSGWVRNRIPHLVANQKVIKDADGGFTMKLKVSSLNEMAKWVMSRLGDVVAIKPEALVELIQKKAKIVIEKHRKA